MSMHDHDGLGSGVGSELSVESNDHVGWVLNCPFGQNRSTLKVL